MTEPISQERWAAGYALMRGEMPAQVRVAAVMGTNETTVSKKRARDGWKVIDFSARGVRPLHDLLHQTFWARILDDPGQAPLLLERARQFVAWLPVADSEPPPLTWSGPDAAGEEAGDAQATDGEQTPDEPGGDEQVARLGRVLSRQLDRLLSAVDAGGGMLTKAQVELLTVIMRLAEKFGALAAESAAQKQTRSDDELADMLRRVDARILALAHALAEQMAAGRADP